jgi:hypothetical protein
MKSHREELTFNVPARMDFVNITREVERADLSNRRYVLECWRRYNRSG